MSDGSISDLLKKAAGPRRALFDSRHETAFRLFNGFSEGCPDLVIDVYGATAVIDNYAAAPEQSSKLLAEARRFLQHHLPWLRAGLLKSRNGKSAAEKRGELLFGSTLDRKIREHGIWYAIDLAMNRDSSFYLDTRNLRKWILANARGRTVLNAFAYTGSLGIAAAAGSASRVVQLDRNRGFLNVAKTSCTLNGFPIQAGDFLAADFFSQVARYKRAGERFDIALLDPPFFSETSRGRVDQITHSAQLINKVRPLIQDGGILIAVNNALYVSGRDYMQTLESLCADGYLKIRELIPVPEDMTGYGQTQTVSSITDPAPFNHSTKIAVLEVHRKKEPA